MLTEALATQAEPLVRLLPHLRAALDQLGDPGNLTLLQGIMLAAATLELRPEVILDLGTGLGNSAAVFGLTVRDLGRKVYTFDLFPNWAAARLKLRPALQTRVDTAVVPVVGDITLKDPASLIGSAERVLVFWDAHGYAIAEWILGHLMPAIAHRRHVVICHDMSDNRLPTPRSYERKGFWRGVDGAASDATTAYVNLGWVITRVEQAIPIIDFCWRNGIELHSFDWELHRASEITVRTDIFPRLGLSPELTLNMTYFSLNESRSRFFPSAS